jgi:transposase
MPVANEIIKSRDEQNADWDLTDLKYALQTTNIEYVYKAVVKFINEYNKRK